MDLQNCGKVATLAKPSFPDNFPLSRQAVLPKLNFHESTAYTMWDQGYTAEDILSTMVKYRIISGLPSSDVAGVMYVSLLAAVD